MKLKQEPYDEMKLISERVEAGLEPGRGVRVDVASSSDGAFMSLGFGSGLVYQLRTDGRSVHAPVFADYLGSDYRAGEGNDQVVRIDVDSPPPAGARVLASLRVEDAPDPGDELAPKVAPVRTVKVTLAPPAGAP